MLTHTTVTTRKRRRASMTAIAQAANGMTAAAAQKLTSSHPASLTANAPASSTVICVSPSRHDIACISSDRSRYRSGLLMRRSRPA